MSVHAIADITPIRPELSDHNQAKLQTFLDDLSEDADVVRDQRMKAREDTRFLYAPNGHWEGFLEKEFDKRAKFQLDVTSPYKNRFIAEWNTNEVGVEYKPDDDENATQKEASILTGRHRIDFREGAGKIARDNAVDEVATNGYGCYLLATQFEDESDPENEKQRIVRRPIYSAYNSVIWDRATKWIDKRDSRRVTYLEEFTEDSFKESFPGHDPVSAYVPEDWNNYTDTFNPKKIIYVATRYEISKKKRPVFVYRNLEAGALETYTKEDHDKIKDELRQRPYMEFVRERKIIQQTVNKTVFSGDMILEPTRRIVGRYLPIIAMYGYRGYVDGQEWYKGLVRGLKDAQRLFNMQISKLAEVSASSGTGKPIFGPEQVIGKIGENWAEMINKPYLTVNPQRDPDGKIVIPGPMAFLPPAQLDQATISLMQIVPDFIRQSTGGAPQETLDPDASGKAIEALIKRENQDTQPIMANIATSQEWDGIVWLAMAQEVYDTPRLLRTLGKDGVEGAERILGTVQDEETGKLIQSNKFAGKRFRVYADVGPQYDSLQEQVVEELKGMLEILGKIQGAEKYIPAVLAMMLKNSRGPGMEVIQKMVRQDLLLMGLVDPENDEEKQFMQQAQQNQKPDPQAQLAESLAIQAEAEGRERDSKTLVNTANAQKAIAQIKEILAGIQMDQANTESDILINQAKIENEIRKTIFEGVQGLPLGVN